MRSQDFILATLLILAPFGATAADLVVWWDKGYSAQEDKALKEIIAAFEQASGKQVEVTFYPDAELPTKIDAAIEAGQPPDFAYRGWVSENIARWAFDDRLVDLRDTIGSFANLFDAHALDGVTFANGRTGRRGLYGLPIGRVAYYFHVWKASWSRRVSRLPTSRRSGSLSGRSGAIRCSQPCGSLSVVTTSGASNMSATSADTWVGFYQFMIANDADYVTPDGKLLLDDANTRQKLAKAIDSYTAIYRKGCTPPDAVNWSTDDRNNKAFLAQKVVATPNGSLSIPNVLKRERPDAHRNNVATFQWPLGPGGQSFPIWGQVWPAVVFGVAATPLLLSSSSAFS
jgi:multiple sugar transport system substrate-binding protein